MQNTLYLFEKFSKHYPPFLPLEVKEKMQKIFLDTTKKASLSAQEIELAMIKIGYEVWPYNQAYYEFFNKAWEEKGEHYFVSFLDENLISRYRDFKLYGGTFKDVFSGNPANFFDIEERGELCKALVESCSLVDKFVRQEVVSLGEKEYMAKVEDCRKILKRVKKEIEDLYALAYKETDHPILVDEIKEKIKSFEESLCWLGPELNTASVCDSVEFFTERKMHLNNMRGIHLVIK